MKKGVLTTALFAAAACGNNGPIVAPDVPRAFIRYVNAMPDTLGVDFRAVDIVENSPYIATLFRDIKQAGYTPVAAGSRRFREFLSNPSSPSASTVTHVLVDTTMSLEAGAHYTMAHVGFARAGQTPAAKFVVMKDNIPTPPAGQVAFRVINLAAGLGTLDVYMSAASTGALPPAATFSGAAYLVPTSYVYVAATATTATLSFRATAANAGSSATVVATVTVPAGDPGTPSLDPIPGSAISGSVFTVYVFPRSSPGSLAPQTAAFQIPVMVVVPEVALRVRGG